MRSEDTVFRRMSVNEELIYEVMRKIPSIMLKATPDEAGQI